jgi:hypothetical protein
MERFDEGHLHPSIKNPETDMSRPGFGRLHRRRALYQRAIKNKYKLPSFMHLSHSYKTIKNML